MPHYERKLDLKSLLVGLLFGIVGSFGIRSGRKGEGGPKHARNSHGGSGSDQEMMEYVCTYKGGRTVWFFALAHLAGIRTGQGDSEITRLANSPNLLKSKAYPRPFIDLETIRSRLNRRRQRREKATVA